MLIYNASFALANVAVLLGSHTNPELQPISAAVALICFAGFLIGLARKVLR